MTNDSSQEISPTPGNPCLPFKQVKRACDGCGAPLTGRQRRWCKGDCDALYWSHHRWTNARAAILGRSRYPSSHDRVRRRTDRYRCERCGCTCGHSWDPEVPNAEVNHIIPAMGAHGEESCAHHHDNLELLCHDCHAVETKQQAADRARRRRAQLELEVE